MSFLPALCIFLPVVLPAQPVARLTYGTYLSTPSPIAAPAASPVTVPSFVVLDRFGNTFIAAPLPDESATLLTEVSRDGHSQLFKVTLAHASPTALLLDSANNVFLAGTTNPGFETTPKAFQTSPGYGFLAKFSPAGDLLWASFVSAVPTALAVDSAGLPYLTGYTDSAFVTTPGALKSDIGGAALCGGPRDVPRPCNDAVIAKVSADGSRLLYATYLGGSRTDEARSIQIDSTGAIWIAGDTQSVDFPVTPDALQPVLNLGQPVSHDPYLTPSDAFIAVLKADGSGLAYATYFGGTAGDIAYTLLLEGDGSYYLVGGTASADFPVTPGAFQTIANPENLNDPAFGDAFFARFNRTNTVRYASFYGTSEPESARAAALSRTGRLDFLDGSYPRRGCAPDITLVSVDRETGQVLTTQGIHGVAFQTVSLAIDSSGVDYIAGHAIFNSDPFAVTPDALSQEGSTLLLRVDLARTDEFLPVCLTNAASFTQTIVNAGSGPALAPGEIISLFGYGLNGPGIRLLVDGIDIPVLYSGANQINAAVPLSVLSGSARLTVRSDAFSVSYPIQVAPAFPGIFMDNGQAIALNADGSLNSRTNPAGLGSAIYVFATGLGTLDTFGQASNPFHLTFGAGPLIEYKTVAVESAEQAPGLPAGVYRIRVTVPVEAAVPESWVRIDLDGSLSALTPTPAQTVWIRRPLTAHSEPRADNTRFHSAKVKLRANIAMHFCFVLSCGCSGCWYARESMDASESALTREEMERRRLAAAQHLLTGTSQARVARMYGVSRTTTSRWHSALTRKGVDSLRKRRATGRPSRLTPEQLGEVVQIFRAGALESGYPTDRWTTGRLASVIESRFAVHYDEDHVGRLMHKLGLRATREAFYAASLYSPNTALSASAISPTVP